MRRTMVLVSSRLRELKGERPPGLQGPGVEYHRGVNVACDRVLHGVAVVPRDGAVNGYSPRCRAEGLLRRHQRGAVHNSDRRARAASVDKIRDERRSEGAREESPNDEADEREGEQSPAGSGRRKVGRLRNSLLPADQGEDAENDDEEQQGDPRDREPVAGIRGIQEDGSAEGCEQGDEEDGEDRADEDPPAVSEQGYHARHDEERREYGDGHVEESSLDHEEDERDPSVHEPAKQHP